ncbi:MAG: cell division protein FtsW [Phycisphaeraceae bacterium]|nr:cell division protein FtsW [Phycisphaeraceae bacterium]
MRAGQLIQVIAAGLLALGVLMVHSASMSVGAAVPHPFAFLESRHTLFALAALVLMLAASRLPWERWIHTRSLLCVPVMWFAAGLVLVGLTFVPSLGRTINGATRWLELGAGSVSIMFQPSEVLKYGLVIFLAWWCVQCGPMIRHWGRGFLPALGLVAVASGLVLVEDFGTALLMGAVAALVLLAGSARLWHLLILAPPAALAFTLAIVHKPHRIERLRTFMDPFSDLQASGYQASQGLLALAQGGMWGRGLGNGIQKHDYLPTDTSDMILAVIGEELGLVAVGGVIVAFMVLLIAGLQIMAQTQSLGARLMILGVMATVGVQALINIAVVLVVVPTKGMALPLISAGGTGWMMTGLMLGIVASFDRVECESGARSESPVKSKVISVGEEPVPAG